MVREDLITSAVSLERVLATGLNCVLTRSRSPVCPIVLTRGYHVRLTSYVVLQDPSVAGAPVEKRIAFLQSKNLTQEEIDVSLARAAEDTNHYHPPPPQAASTQGNAYRQPPPPPAYGAYPPQGYWPPPPPPE
jgi:hypothetical protein